MRVKSLFGDGSVEMVMVGAAVLLGHRMTHLCPGLMCSAGMIAVRVAVRAAALCGIVVTVRGAA